MSRDVVLVVYAAVIGWYLHRWWEAEREHLVWDAAARASALSTARENGAAPAATGSNPS